MPGCSSLTTSGGGIHGPLADLDPAAGLDERVEMRNGRRRVGARAKEGQAVVDEVELAVLGLGPGLLDVSDREGLVGGALSWGRGPG
jgi:hypothetical protein